MNRWFWSSGAEIAGHGLGFGLCFLLFYCTLSSSSLYLLASKSILLQQPVQLVLCLPQAQLESRRAMLAKRFRFRTFPVRFRSSCRFTLGLPKSWQQRRRRTIGIETQISAVLTRKRANRTSSLTLPFTIAASAGTSAADPTTSKNHLELS